jgi:hypothetical protein
MHARGAGKKRSMAIIEHSPKFNDTPGHYKAYTDDGVILFRIVRASRAPASAAASRVRSASSSHVSGE